VYLAAVLAGYTRKRLAAFGIYGRDVPEKILRFVRSGARSSSSHSARFDRSDGCQP
jgi:hypothetical protein